MTPIRASSAVALAVGAVLAGCVAPTASDVERASTSARDLFTLPVIVDDSKGVGEPSIAIGPDGRVYVAITGAGSAGGEAIYVSEDEGATWTELSDPTGPFGGSDVDIAVGPDNVLYATGLWLGCVSAASSKDGGQTWTKWPLACGGAVGDDRQWVAADADGVAYVVFHGTGWSGDYFVTKTTDAGATWGPAVPVTIHGGFPGNVFVHSASHNVYVAYGGGEEPTHGPTSLVTQQDTAYYVSVSKDGGLTWTEHKVADVRGEIEGLNHAAGAVDDEGNVYVAWNEIVDGALDVYYAYSTDEGATWSEPARVNAAGGTHTFPWIAARRDGVVGVAWYETAGNGTAGTAPADAAWRVAYAETASGHDADAAWTEAVVTPEPMHEGPICANGLGCNMPAPVGTPGDRDLLDFFEIAFDAEGRIHLVWADDTGSDVRDPHARSLAPLAERA